MKVRWWRWGVLIVVRCAPTKHFGLRHNRWHDFHFLQPRFLSLAEKKKKHFIIVFMLFHCLETPVILSWQSYRPFLLWGIQMKQNDRHAVLVIHIFAQMYTEWSSKWTWTEFGLLSEQSYGNWLHVFFLGCEIRLLRTSLQNQSAISISLNGLRK